MIRLLLSRFNLFTFICLCFWLVYCIAISEAQSDTQVCCDRNTKYRLDAGDFIRLIGVWNEQERAGGAYSPENWPHGALAANRSMIFAARTVFLDEWDINTIIASQHGGEGFIQIAEAETNYWLQHEDYPAHFHLNFVWTDFSGGVNSHFYTSEDGQIERVFLNSVVDNCTTLSNFPEAGSWWAQIDVNCNPVFYERWRDDGSIELKLVQNAPVYRLAVRKVAGDLSITDIFLDGEIIYSVEVTEYDPINLRMIIEILDYRQHTITVEAIRGSTEPWDTITEYEVQEYSLLPPSVTNHHQCTYIVSPSGNDAGDGSLQQPWRTVERAAIAAVAGDTVCFRAGVWNERLEPQNSGTLANPITFTAFPGEEHEAILDMGFETGQSQFEGIVHIDSQSHITVENLTVTNAQDFGIFVRLSENVVIRNNQIDYTWSSGIFIIRSKNIIVDANDLQRVTHGQGGTPGHESLSISGDTENFVIRNNRIHNPFRDPQSGEVISKEGIDAKDGVANGRIYGNYVNIGNSIGIYVDAFDAYVTNLAIYGNEVMGNSYGIVIASEQGGSIDNLNIYNNIIHQNELIGLHMTDWVTGGRITNVKISNNTVVANGDNGINISSTDIVDVLIQNNIAVQHRENDLILRPSVPLDQITLRNNLINQDAGFVDSNLSNFHLQPNSPAIDTGELASAPLFDYDGTSRPFGPAIDIGAFEWTTDRGLRPVLSGSNTIDNVPQFAVFDPSLSKIGFLKPRQTDGTGEYIEWIITVSNTGTVVGENVTITDTLVAGLLVDKVEAPNANMNINAQTVVVSYPRLEANETIQFSIFATVLDDVEVTNTACVTATNQAAAKCTTGNIINQLPQTGEISILRRWLWSILILALAVLAMQGILTTCRKYF